MAAEKRPFERHKDETRTRIISVLALLGLVYAFFFLPESVLNYFKEGLTSVWSTIINLGLMGSIGGLVGYVVMALDVLATGQGKTARFFQAQYPSEAIRQHYPGTTRDQANYLWFQVFNPWENIGPMKDLYARTFDRSYACRFLFVLQWSFLGFFLLSLFTWIATLVFPLEPSKPGALFARITLLATAILAFFVLLSLNRPTGPSGCWARLEEINGIHRAWLETEVFAHAPTYADAVNLVASQAWRLARGYPAPPLPAAAPPPAAPPAAAPPPQ